MYIYIFRIIEIFSNGLEYINDKYDIYICINVIMLPLTIWESSEYYENIKEP